MDDAIAMLEACESQFRHYAELHRSKGTDDGRRKAATNLQFADQCAAVIKRHNGSRDLAKIEQVPDYRFGTFMKGEHYAFARGLTINPSHLPGALDAMERDGWHLISIFGQTDSSSIGFIFRRNENAPK